MRMQWPDKSRPSSEPTTRALDPRSWPSEALLRFAVRAPTTIRSSVHHTTTHLYDAKHESKAHKRNREEKYVREATEMLGFKPSLTLLASASRICANCIDAVSASTTSMSVNTPIFSTALPVGGRAVGNWITGVAFGAAFGATEF